MPPSGSTGRTLGELAERDRGHAEDGDGNQEEDDCGTTNALPQEGEEVHGEILLVRVLMG